MIKGGHSLVTVTPAHLAVAVAVVLSSMPYGAEACTCFGPIPSFEDAASTAAAVFVGEITEQGAPWQRENVIYVNVKPVVAVRGVDLPLVVRVWDGHYNTSCADTVPTDADWHEWPQGAARPIDLDESQARRRFEGKTAEEVLELFRAGPILSASSFLGLIEHTLQWAPSTIEPVMDEILEAVDFVARNQARYEADIQIYGDFKERAQRIRSLRSA